MDLSDMAGLAGGNEKSKTCGAGISEIQKRTRDHHVSCAIKNSLLVLTLHGDSCVDLAAASLRWSCCLSKIRYQNSHSQHYYYNN